MHVVIRLSGEQTRAVRVHEEAEKGGWIWTAVLHQLPFSHPRMMTGGEKTKLVSDLKLRGSPLSNRTLEL